MTMKNNFSITVISLFLILFVLYGCIENHNPPSPPKTETEKLVLDLSGRWKFRLGDDVTWKDENFNDNV